MIDMEFVQFFPIGHLAPRLIGMDPIMWDPFRYKLGGRLLNAQGEEFAERYGQNESGTYALTRDVATYAIFKEVEAGRGSPAGGAFLSFPHVPEAELRRNFGPVMATAAKITVASVHEIVELGTLDPEAVVTPGLFVQRVVRIDRATTQAGGIKTSGARA